jgi:hypothetical protein
MTAAATGKGSATFRRPKFESTLIVVVGGFGSGKSEVSVNLAKHLSTLPGDPVAIADLDIINPYFRSREAAATLDQLGIRSLVPPGAQKYADLPIIIPEIRAAIERRQYRLVLDVGGDDLGARVLSSLADAFHTAPFELLLVHNARRPFTTTVEGSLKVISEIEDASRLKVTGLVSNTHLTAETTVDTVIEGVWLARMVAEKKGIPLVFVSALQSMCMEIFQKLDGALPILPLDRELLKPWETHHHVPTSMTRKRGV